MKPHTHRQQMNPLVAAKKSRTPSTRSPLKNIAIATVALLCSTACAVAATAGSVTLGWDANPETNIQRYELQYGTVSGNRPNTVDAGTNLSAAVSGLNPGTTYYFAVVARNTLGQVSSPSTELAFTVPGTPNTAPVASPVSLDLEEDSQAPITLSASDAEGDELTYSIAASPSKGTLLGTPPNLTYRAGANQTGSDSFSFRAFDGVLQSSTVTVSVTITPVNDAPVANAKSVTTNEDTNASIALSGTDPDGDTLSYTILGSPSLGTLTGTGANRTYQPSANASGSDSFTFTVSDGIFESEPATVMIAVTPVNDVPVANAGTATTEEDSPVAIVLTGTDVEGSALTYTATTAPTKGTLSGTPPNLTYTPNANSNGSDGFSFRVNDGTANSAAANVVVTISPVNDAPVAVARTATAVRDNPVSIPLTGTDLDEDALSYQVVSGPANGTLTGTPPNVSYKANSGFTGADAFTFRVFDGTTYSAAAGVSIDVKTNSPPTAVAKTVTTNEDTDLAISLTGTDADGDTLTYSIVTTPGKGTIIGSGGNITYRPNANTSGSDSFTFMANDGADDSPPATVSIAITPVNDLPVAIGWTATTAEDTAVGIVLAGNDLEGSTLSFAIVGSPSKGTLSGTPPNVTYTPQANSNGADSFTFRVNDGSANSATATIGINVTPVNDIPVATSRSVSTARNTAVAAVLSATDVEGSALSYTVVTSPVNGTLSGTPPNLTYTPKPDYAGSDSFTFRANDGSANSANATISITVANSNRAPQAHSKSVSTMMSKAVTVELAGSDADANPLSYRITSAPANGTLTGTPPNVIYKPKARWSGADNFSYVVNDGSVDSATATVEVKVKKKNLKPVANLQTMVVNQNSSGSTTLTGTDPDADPLTFAIVVAPANGTLSGALPNLTYTPKAGYRGKDRFSFVASDGMAKSAAAVVEINVVNPNNRAPIPHYRTYATNSKAAVAVPLYATDEDGDPITYRVVEKPSAGKLTGKAPDLIYKPKKNFVGTVRFGYLVNDGAVDSYVAYVTINVSAPPVATARSLATAKETKAVTGLPSPLPVLSLQSDASLPGGLRINVSGTPGQTYLLESSSDLSNWSAKGSVTIGEDGTATLQVVPDGSGGGFYRLSEP